LARLRRFGRRLAVPSSLQILHELRALLADEHARERCAELDGLPRTASWEDIVDRRNALAVNSSTHEEGGL
jgi:hypothetical protein